MGYKPILPTLYPRPISSTAPFSENALDTSQENILLGIVTHVRPRTTGLSVLIHRMQLPNAGTT